jgi:hypothetical protein
VVLRKGEIEEEEEEEKRVKNWNDDMARLIKSISNVL